MKASTVTKIMELEALLALRKQWAENGETVVFTNGCFDILHLGHVDYLEKAAALGHRLVTGLNSDTSVRQLKGQGRPVNAEYARSRLLAALAFVDAVVLFPQETPLQLISSILPDVLVKGSDYTVENIVGAKEVLQNGGAVKTIDLVSGYSTTSIIHKIGG